MSDVFVVGFGGRCGDVGDVEGEGYVGAAGREDGGVDENATGVRHGYVRLSPVSPERIEGEEGGVTEGQIDHTDVLVGTEVGEGEEETRWGGVGGFGEVECWA